MKKFFEWLVKSSANASQISLTVKGILIGAVPAIIILANLMNINLKNQELTAVIDLVAQLIVLIGGTISVAVTAYGAVRKLILTAAGKNAVLVEQALAEATKFEDSI